MLTVLTLMSKFVLSPLWLLWQLYNGLWWAFEDDPTPALPSDAAGSPANARYVDLSSGGSDAPNGKAASARPGNAESGSAGSARAKPARTWFGRARPAAFDPTQARAFEVVDSSPPKAKPLPRPVSALRGGFFGSLGVSISLAWLANAMVQSRWIDPARAAGVWILSSATVFVTSLWAVRAAVRRESARARAPKGFIRRTIGADTWRARAARASAATLAARAGAGQARTVCATGLRRGVSSLCSNLSKLEAKLGVPKTASAVRTPVSGPASNHG